MLKNIGKILMLILMIFGGIMFITNIYVLGNRDAAVAMHDDLPRSASALLANAKVIKCFVVGILYLIAAVGIIRKRYAWAVAGMIGAGIFIGFYIIQLALWANIHPRMWTDFTIFGGASLLIGIYSWRHWGKRTQTTYSTS